MLHGTMCLKKVKSTTTQVEEITCQLQVREAKTGSAGGRNKGEEVALSFPECIATWLFALNMRDVAEACVQIVA